MRRRILCSPHILPANPRKKPLTRDQVAKKQQKAVDFLDNVVGENEVGQTGKTGRERADEINNESVEAYAERKGIVMENPSDLQLIEQALDQHMPPSATREDRSAAVEAARESLVGAASEAEKVTAICDSVAESADQVLEQERQNQERQHRDLVLEIARIRRRDLVGWAEQQISPHLLHLSQQGEIDRDEWRDPDPELIEEVKAGLRELTGNESYDEARELVGELVGDYLFESEPDEEGEEDDQGEEFEDEEQD